MGELSEVCDVCGKNFRNIKIFTNHLKTHGDQEYTCIHCDKAFYKRILKKQVNTARLCLKTLGVLRDIF